MKKRTVDFVGNKRAINDIRDRNFYNFFHKPTDTYQVKSYRKQITTPTKDIWYQYFSNFHFAIFPFAYLKLEPKHITTQTIRRNI